MELFRSIFAESSSESESEEQEDMSTTHSSVVAVETTPSKTVNSNKTGTAVNENRPPRQQWQNLALLTLPSQPSTSLPPHHPSDTPFFTPTQAEKKTSERVEPPRQVSTNKVRSL